MASPSNNSSSSSKFSSRVLPNTVLRNSETRDPVRRSIAGSSLMKPSIIPSSRGLNPKTPANSPLDHPQRNSSTYCRDLDEKENGKDLNPRNGKLRSPTMTNCTKNFMSPTISASSKIAMSPKKKVLIERNGPIRTSLASSDLKTSSLNSVNFSDLKPDDCSSIEGSLDSTDLRPALKTSSSIPKASKTVTFIDSETKSTGFSDYTMFNDADLVNLDYRFKISPASSPSFFQISASPDEDPYMPPYDPKTNYLSPRPQFLHYRPNPRYLPEEEDGKMVEGSSLFESFSDTEITEETQSDSSRKSDEVSSDGKDKHEEEEEETDHMKTDPCLMDINNSDVNSVGRGNSQPSFRNICKMTALILLLCFACSSVFYSTPTVNRVLHDESMFLRKNTSPSEIYKFAKSKYPELAENLWVWFNNAADFAHGLISNFEEEYHQLSPVRCFNLSASQEDISVDGYFMFYQTHERMNDFLLESELLEEDELLQEDFEFEEEGEENPDEQEQEQEESERHESLESELIDENEMEYEAEEHSEIAEDTKRTCEEEEEEYQESKRPESSEELAEENGRSEFEMVETTESSEEIAEENGRSEFEMVETTESSEELAEENGRPEFEMVEEGEQGSLELDFKGNDVSSAASSAGTEMDAQSNVMRTSKQVILLLIILPPLMAAAIFYHSRRVKTRRQGLRSSEDKLTQIPSSELSNCQKRSSNHRRESLSSSMSTDSASYGSFTAYELISTKHGDLEEEIVTPVRRSSRIKTKLRVDH